MSELQHTPRPWRVLPALDDIFIAALYPAGSVLAKAHPRGFAVACAEALWDRDGGRDTQIANARLIAAAPDLLEAAELARGPDCEECGGEGEPEACSLCFPKFDEARLKRRAAIAKATGDAA